MSLSVQKMRGGPFWPLGFVQVANNGTPVCIMANVDANNNNAPGTPSVPGQSSEYSPSFRGLGIQGYKPGNNNNGMVANTGNVYLLAAPAGGSGNRSDSGSIVKVIAPGQDFFYPPEALGIDRFSPYTLYLDADVNGEGAQMVGYSPAGA
jgi:hypothetical protein